MNQTPAAASDKPTLDRKTLRGVLGAIISLCIALGLLMALRLLNVTGF